MTAAKSTTAKASTKAKEDVEAQAKKDAEAQAKKDAEAQAKAEAEEPIPALWIRSAAGSVRCCGHRFHPEPYGIALSALTDEEVDILKSDTRLVVEDVLGE